MQVQDELPEGFHRTEALTMFNMAWPMMVSFFCRMAMASVDSAFVGHIETGNHSPKDYLAAAGLSDMVVNILVIPPLAFNQSLNALVSQAIGSGNKKMAGTWLQLSVFWLTVGYIPCLFSFFFVGDILALLGFTPDICHLAGKYAKWNVFWPIPNGWYQCMRFYFQAQGITRPAMYNNMLFLGVNVLLNWIFVFGGPFRALCGWQGFGFIGAAMSLSVSRSSQPLAYWLYMFVWKKAHTETWPGFNLGFMQKERNKAFMAQSLPQVGTLILQATINQSTTLMIAQLGKVAIAASSACVALTQIFTGGLSTTLNATCGIRVGFHLGQGNGRCAKESALMVFKCSAMCVGVIGAVLIPLRHQATALMTSDTQVQALAAPLLTPVLLNTFAGIIVQCNTGGVFTSQGRTKLSTILSMGVELPLSIGTVAIFIFVLHFGLVPVYWGQAAVTCLEMAICIMIFVGSNWVQYAEETCKRQEVGAAVASPTFSASPGSLAGVLDSAIGSRKSMKEYQEFGPLSPVVLSLPFTPSPRDESDAKEGTVSIDDV